MRHVPRSRTMTAQTPARFDLTNSYGPHLCLNKSLARAPTLQNINSPKHASYLYDAAVATAESSLMECIGLRASRPKGNPKRPYMLSSFWVAIGRQIHQTSTLSVYASESAVGWGEARTPVFLVIRNAGIRKFNPGYKPKVPESNCFMLRQSLIEQLSID
jgi:hypothetical protein